MVEIFYYIGMHILNILNYEMKASVSMDIGEASKNEKLCYHNGTLKPSLYPATFIIGVKLSGKRREFKGINYSIKICNITNFIFTRTECLNGYI